ncbi:MAG: cysteine--tRNA ligase [Holosporales bacterium]|jgi:cysteinyl-tRNA synthetase|nr:cysteine--tRNA ligase [Holosporales bacterium]
MQLKLSNTLSGKKEIFVPIDENNIRMYVCGPTVYDRAHLGNARPVVVFDILYRVLKLLYNKVLYVRNITDIDDKIYNAAKSKNIDIQELTEENIKFFHDDISKLNVLDVDIEPRATEHIPDMIQFIEKLIENNNAYLSNNHVYFDISSFENYGKFSKKNLNELKEGARIKVAEIKKNQMDFVLWKPVDKNFDFGWESPWGKGRPGWHIECSAMSDKYLGEIFDIHGGGIDLIFPHHENEIAQSCSIKKMQTMANYWVHNGHLTLNSIKMSKSGGNSFTVNEFLEKFDGEVLKLAFLTTHYASPLNFSLGMLAQAKNILDRWYNAIKDLKLDKFSTISQDVLDAILDDLNTPKAISILSKMVDNINKGQIAEAPALVGTCRRVLGILMKDPVDWFRNVDLQKEEWIKEKINQRAIAKDNKNYQLADDIRNELLRAEIVIEDTANGTIWKNKF